MPMKALGVHTFAGLFTEGVKQVFEVVAVANNGYGDSTHRKNHPDIPIYKTNEIPDLAVDFIYAQPECTPWSNNGKCMGLTDPRLQSTEDVFNIAYKLKPDFVALESVVAAFTAGRHYYEEKCVRFKNAGYMATHLLIDNQFCGTPQRRLRYFLLLHKNHLRGMNLTDSVPLLQTLKSVSPGGAELLTGNARRAIEKFGWVDIHQGTYLNKWFSQQEQSPTIVNGRMKGRPPIGDKRLRGDEVPPTFTGIYTFLHPTENRALTMNEAKAWCGVRPDYILDAPGVGEQAKLLARSVMPGVGKWIATTAEMTLRGEGGIEFNDEVVDLRKRRTDVLTID